MERIFTFILLCASVEGKITHFFNSTLQSWPDALAYCRRHYTDLSYIGSQSDQDDVLKAAGKHSPTGWVGMHRLVDNESVWYWTAGGNVTYLNWDVGQPSNTGGNENALQILRDGKWNDYVGGKVLPFYCMDILVSAVREMSWEEALQYCKQNKSNLPDLRSQSDLLQVRKGLQLDNVTDSMWIGLRYLSDVWMWMSGDPQVKSTWPQSSRWMCPTKRCGVLSKSGGWMPWDCQDRLNFICT